MFVVLFLQFLYTFESFQNKSVGEVYNKNISTTKDLQAPMEVSYFQAILTHLER
jgi:hypothetical protein